MARCVGVRAWSTPESRQGCASVGRSVDGCLVVVDRSPDRRFWLVLMPAPRLFVAARPAMGRVVALCVSGVLRDGWRGPRARPGTGAAHVQPLLAFGLMRVVQCFGAEARQNRFDDRGVIKAQCATTDVRLSLLHPRTTRPSSASNAWFATSPSGDPGTGAAARPAYPTHAATRPRLPLGSATASEHQSTSAPGLPPTWPPVRESRRSGHGRPSARSAFASMRLGGSCRWLSW